MTPTETRGADSMSEYNISHERMGRARELVMFARACSDNSGGRSQPGSQGFSLKI